MSAMRSVTALVIVVLAVAFASPALAAPEARRLWTYVRFLVGHPEATADTGVLVVPGPAVLTGGQEAERQAFDVLRVIKEMKESLRLADLQPVGFASLWLTVGKEELAPSTPGGPTVHLTLLGYDDTTATYQIRLIQDDTPPTEAKITVKRDGRGLLGARDGVAAPYFVLMVEPTPPPPAAGPNQLLRPDAVPAKIISRVAPEYPPDAREARLEGVVILAATIAKDGSVRELRPVRSEPLGLTEATIKAVSQWRYEPARDAAGNPVEEAFYVTVSFTLQDKFSAQGTGGILRTPIVLVPDFPPASKLPAGTLVAIGCGPPRNAAKPEDGFVAVWFRTTGLVTWCVRVPKDAVEFFTWTCPALTDTAQATAVCTPFETSGPRKGQWWPELVEQAKKTAEKLHVNLTAEVSMPPPEGDTTMLNPRPQR